ACAAHHPAAVDATQDSSAARDVAPPAPARPWSAACPSRQRGRLKHGQRRVASAPAGVLTQVLKKEGLFAMAKFLKDSGLDSILNDTGPYTIFIPTDKAFRALLVQLGGPDKAEIKFRENPRLLSGLLLHHVIPGAFRLGDLQDEMTGVSLAGTQLRVNTYRTQDTHWNDVQALAAAPGGELQRALKDAGRARALLQRHLVAGALYGAGLRFYQERPSLAANRPVALAKADGQLKANSAHVLTPNIPATNGVLHVIDSVL
ncbi:Transforming growth factor-beta-induced protein ig-h3, partial [Gryllus bimaculatus]